MIILKSFIIYGHLFTLKLLQKRESGKGPRRNTWPLTLLWDHKVSETRMHISQLKKPPLDIWSCVNAGDLKIRRTGKRRGWHRGRLFLPMMSDQENQGCFFLFLLLLLTILFSFFILYFSSPGHIYFAGGSLYSLIPLISPINLPTTLLSGNQVCFLYLRVCFVFVF